MTQLHPALSTPAQATPAEASTSGFAELGVPQPIAAALAATGITSPFPIQSATLPDSLAGRDVLGRGRTGSGKTVAFAVPTVAALAASNQPRRPGSVRALILVPTRELAAQVRQTLEPLADAVGLRTMTIFGGVGQGPQVAALRRGMDICIATPGRLEDLIKQRQVRLDAVEVTVLDEADHMADLGFLPAVKRLLDATPTRTQRLLFSATLDRGVDVFFRRYLHNPVTHSVDSAASEVPQMTHHVFTVAPDNKGEVVRELVSGQGRTLAFTRTKHAAKKLAKQLTSAGVPAVDMHGNLSQGARQRNLAAFGDGSVRVLVATDIAARGIHVDDVALVVHVDPPTEHKAYLHRSGRTARAGAEGIVVTIGTPSQASDVRTLMRQAAIKPAQHAVAPGDPVISRVSGPPAAFVQPTPVQAASSGSARSGEPGQRREAGGGRRRGGSGGRTRPSTPSSSSAPSNTGGRRQGPGEQARTGSSRGAAEFSAGRRRGR
ncbi:MAG: ATP-dependent RNA helicase [uncultured Propionibacteriaceae bacterium]|uniref:ATP-dependent RNA helicase n=1 Tax=uncultured Propionibacteriaceae bacterium TaxID=257457 RepID=A0A6J4NDZ3_9ACTN|nr:MAG: ATP-dependent RNA helicase [uncultured Propionibacteriaceae bacterium]